MCHSTLKPDQSHLQGHKYALSQRSTTCSKGSRLAPPTAPLFNRSHGPFSRSFLIDQAKNLLLLIGVSTSKYSGKSLRKKGAAISVTREGVPRSDIKLLGRGEEWCSRHLHQLGRKTGPQNKTSKSSMPASLPLIPSIIRPEESTWTPPRSSVAVELQKKFNHVLLYLSLSLF
jgi:hypothetical protein